MQKNEPIKIVLKHLSKCPLCSWEPSPQKPKEKTNLGEVWTVIPSPAPGIWFLICPSCKGVFVNENYVENIELVVQQRESNLILPPKDVVVPRLVK